METKSTYINFLFCLVFTIYYGCDQTIKDNKNTLLNSWSGIFGGIPAFDQIQVEDVEEAMLYSIASHLEEIHKKFDLKLSKKLLSEYIIYLESQKSHKMNTYKIDKSILDEIKKEYSNSFNKMKYDIPKNLEIN